MIIAINGRIFPTTGLIKGGETAAFLHRLLEPSPNLSPRLHAAKCALHVVPPIHDLEEILHD